MGSLTVLHAIDTLDRGGAERLLVDLVNTFEPQRVRPVVCTTRARGDLAGDIAAHIPLETLGRRRTWDFRAINQFARVVLDHGVDIIHAHGYSTTMFTAAARSLTGISCPIICHAHSSAPAPWGMRPARFAIAHLVSPSEEGAAQARAGMAMEASTVSVIPNAVDLRRYRPARQDTQDRLVTGVVLSNIRPVKDILSLLRAVARCRSRTKLKIVLAGAICDRRYFEACEKVCHEEGLDNTVQFVGSIADVHTVLAAADFGLLSSRRETGPIALIEYMASGLPFAATLTGQVAHTCHANGIGAFVAVGDVTALAAEIDRLVELTPEERSSSGRSGHRLASALFDSRNACERLVGVYEQLLRPETGTGPKCIESSGSVANF